MAFMGNSVNSSAVIAEKAGAAITGGAGLAVKYDGSGDIVICSTAGEAALGVLIAQTADCAKGDEVCVQIKDCGLWMSGGAVSKGAQLAVNAAGKAVAATEGQFILGVALESCAAAGRLINVQICKCGIAG